MMPVYFIQAGHTERVKHKLVKRIRAGEFLSTTAARIIAFTEGRPVEPLVPKRRRTVTQEMPA